ncbi:MAG: saccharopine dehydrogenase NADP-binding domain-containing protein [Bacteroidetes bacterium]|nr:saccharopine dehydrogenase NADP-binding domain-containing protein [Bacteroidota bacterium]
MKDKLLIYGCNGYTGALISRLAVRKGLKPILSGRNEAAVKKLADELGMTYRIYDMQIKSDAALQDVKVVLHCAGPFIYTSKPMLEACLRNKVHYLDITGEILVFEGAHEYDAAAKSAGILVMPGVGFDVVPTDCMSLYLKEQLPDADKLELCLMNKGGRLSHGTAITIAENMGNGSLIRKNGVITKTRSGYTTREIDFGFTKKVGAEIPWGDVSTAYYTTGIPNIRVYNILPKQLISSMKLSNYIGPILRMRWVKDRAIAKIKTRPAGPDDKERAEAQSFVWGEVTSKSGATQRALLTLPEGYSLTADTAVEIASRVLDPGFSATGFHTPASVFGSGFILDFAGTDLKNL